LFQAEHKGDGIVHLAEEISGQHSIQAMG
jgi:hypothetical protein